MNTRPKHLKIALLLGATFLVLITVGTLVFARINPTALVNFGSNQAETINFPAIDPDLSAARQSILAITQQEFENPGPGTKYADGQAEPWCADFVSWIMREAGHPLKNPHTNSWRIPGVYTLQEYFQQQGAFAPVTTDYAPRPGDIAIYKDGIFGHHTNIVVAADKDTITTVGGNENFKITLRTFTFRDSQYGLLGFAHPD